MLPLLSQRDRANKNIQKNYLNEHFFWNCYENITDILRSSIFFDIMIDGRS